MLLILLSFKRFIQLYQTPPPQFSNSAGLNSWLCKYQVNALPLATLGATRPALNSIVYIIQNQGDLQNSDWDIDKSWQILVVEMERFPFVIAGLKGTL